MSKFSATRNIPSLSTRAAWQSATANADKRTVDVVWTTGAKVVRTDWWSGERFVEELAVDSASVRLGRLNNGAPFLADHDGGSVASTLGVVESARIENGQGIATVRFPSAGVDPVADQVFRKIQDGIIQNVSVGYRVHKFEKSEPGPDNALPVMRAVDWEPFEISAVSIGADDAAGFRNAQSALNSCEFVTRGTPQKAKQMDPKDEVKPAPATTDADRSVDLDAVKAQARKDELARVTGIQQATRAAKLPAEFADKLISAGTALDAARAAVLSELAERSSDVEIDGHSGVQVVAEEREKSLRGAEVALMQRYGMMPMARAVQAKGKTASEDAQRAFGQVAVDAGEFGGMRPIRIAQEFLERQGKRTRGLADDKIVDLAMRSVSGEQTTSDFGVLLANIMYKQSLGQYTLADDTWRKFCRTDNVQDFRPSNRYRIGTFGVLDLMPEGAEYKNAAIPDGLKQALTVQTKGKMLSLGRQAIINDDMGAVLATAGEFGRSAALSIEVDVYALLNANSGLGATFGSNPFFDSSNSNVNATGSALSVSALEADRQVLVTQKDISSNEYLGLGKRGNMVMLVPASLEMSADRLNSAQYDPTANQFELPNYSKGFFRDVIGSPRLTASATRRYIFDMAQNAGAIVVAFLAGQEAPFLEQRLGWRVDGIEWKLRLDYQAQFFDPKLAVTNAGA